jgi:hypothetical protein
LHETRVFVSEVNLLDLWIKDLVKINFY